jgi:DNA-binding NarL/FixJ family response regulator
MGWEPLRYVERLADFRLTRLPALALISSDPSAASASAMLINAGARGVLLQDANPERLAAALISLAQGLVVLTPAFAEAQATHALTPSLNPGAGIDGMLPPETLTPRESEVLHLIAEGLPNKTIALQLSISEHTVKFHVNAILTKLGAQSRTEAVVRATRAGLIAL